MIKQIPAGDRRQNEGGWCTHFNHGYQLTHEYLGGSQENFPGRYMAPRMSFDHGTFQMFNWIPGVRNIWPTLNHEWGVC